MTREQATEAHKTLADDLKVKVQEAIEANEAVAEFERTSRHPLPTAVYPISRTQFNELQTQRWWW